MGTLDDAIREHLELKRRLGASAEELDQKETEAFGAGRQPSPAAPPAAPPAELDAREEAAEIQLEHPAPPDEPLTAEPDVWAPPGDDDDLLGPDEVLPQDALEPNGGYPPPVERPADVEEREAEESHEDPFDEWEEEPAPAPTEDVLQETPEFLEETPEHDRLWFEQRPPKDFDFD